MPAPTKKLVGIIQKRPTAGSLILGSSFLLKVVPVEAEAPVAVEPGETIRESAEGLSTVPIVPRIGWEEGSAERGEGGLVRLGPAEDCRIVASEAEGAGFFEIPSSWFFAGDNVVAEHSWFVGGMDVLLHSKMGMGIASWER